MDAIGERNPGQARREPGQVRRDRHDAGDAATEEASQSATSRRTEDHHLLADLQIREAMARGAFDNLPGAGKPLKNLDGRHDPDWWLKGLVEREKLTGLAPPAIGLRTEDAGLQDRLDREGSEAQVRRILVDFNARVVEARRQLLGGPPVITQTRDVETEIAAWRQRGLDRLRSRAAAARSGPDDTSAPAPRTKGAGRSAEPDDVAPVLDSGGGRERRSRWRRARRTEAGEESTA